VDGKRWAHVEHADVELPAQVEEALRMARQRAGDARLPVVLTGDVVCVALVDFTAWYGPLPDVADEAPERVPQCPQMPF